MTTDSYKETIRLVLIDTYQLVREGIRQVLEPHTEIDVVAEGRTIEDAIQYADEYNPHIILIDIKIIKKEGFSTIKGIIKQFPQTKIIILSEQDDDNLMIQALKVGATGYLIKEMNPDTFMSAIKAVHNGQYWYHPHVTNNIIRDYYHLIQEIFGKKESDNESEHHLAIFTPREYEVLQLLGKGYSNKVMAEQLNITQFTINSHVRNILKKSNVNDRTQAVVKAVEEGWITIEKKKVSKIE